jgi:hypothetical protein
MCVEIIFVAVMLNVLLLLHYLDGWQWKSFSSLVISHHEHSNT